MACPGNPHHTWEKGRGSRICRRRREAVPGPSQSLPLAVSSRGHAPPALFQTDESQTAGGCCKLQKSEQNGRNSRHPRERSARRERSGVGQKTPPRRHSRGRSEDSDRGGWGLRPRGASLGPRFLARRARSLITGQVLASNGGSKFWPPNVPTRCKPTAVRQPGTGSTCLGRA